MKLKFTKIRDVKSPEYGTPGSAGIDFFVPNDIEEHTIFPGGSFLVPSGIKVSFKRGHALIAFNKSGIASKKHLVVGACVVDSDYQGEIFINLNNIGTEPQTIAPGDKIVQFIMLPIKQVEIYETNIEDLSYDSSLRGEGGFGSTGHK